MNTSTTPSLLNTDFWLLHVDTTGDSSTNDEERYGDIAQVTNAVDDRFGARIAEVTSPYSVYPFDNFSHDQLAYLSMAAATQDESRFVRAYRSVNWLVEPAESYVQAVRLALSAGAHQVARQLSAMGHERFPEHAELRKMAHILAPPTVRTENRGPNPGISANNRWLAQNRTTYQGQWVALKAGDLLASADTIDLLVAQVGDVRGRGILITKVY